MGWLFKTEEEKITKLQNEIVKLKEKKAKYKASEKKYENELQKIEELDKLELDVNDKGQIDEGKLLSQLNEIGSRADEEHFLRHHSMRCSLEIAKIAKEIDKKERELVKLKMSILKRAA